MNNSKTEIKHFTVRRGGVDYSLTARKYFVGLFEAIIVLGGDKLLISKVPPGLTPEEMERAKSFALECWDSPYNAIDLDDHDKDAA